MVHGKGAYFAYEKPTCSRCGHVYVDYFDMVKHVVSHRVKPDYSLLLPEEREAFRAYNRERMREYSKTDAYKAWRHRYRKTEKLKAWHDDYVSRNREKLNAISRAYYARNRDAINARARARRARKKAMIA